ncbi:MAG: hypothetical protein RLZ98_3254 [Pseudomonadota bacterium]|jgi:homoserine kinase type II
MAVYTEVSDDDLARFIERYAIGRVLSYKGIAEGVENTNYLVETEAGRYILTLYEKRVASGDLPFFLGLMEHLAARGISCPLPVRDVAGNNLGTLAGRPAALVTFLDGVWVRRPQVKHCAMVGEALAHLHLAGLDFPMQRPNALGLPGWRLLYETFADRTAEVSAELGAMIEDELCWLESNFPHDLQSGVIHADLFPDNAFFLGDRFSGLIDFYFACNDFLAYDIAICINAWCFEPDRTFNATKGRALLRGYQNIRPLEPAEHAALPALCRGAALRFLLTRTHDWVNHPPGALVKPHDPLDYIERLKFHRSIAAPSGCGLEAEA